MKGSLTARLYSSLVNILNVRRIRRQLEEKGAVIKTDTALQEIKDGSIVVGPAKVNYIGTSLAGIRPDTSMLEELDKRFDKVVYVGDCDKPGLIGNATGAAYLAAKNL